MDSHDIVLPTVSELTHMSWFVFVIRLANTYTREERDRVIAGADASRHRQGLLPLHPSPSFYREKFGYSPGDFPISESVSTSTIALPFYNDMTEKDVDHVVRTLKQMLDRENIRRG